MVVIERAGKSRAWAEKTVSGRQDFGCGPGSLPPLAGEGASFDKQTMLAHVGELVADQAIQRDTPPGGIPSRAPK